MLIAEFRVWCRFEGFWIYLFQYGDIAIQKKDFTVDVLSTAIPAVFTGKSGCLDIHGKPLEGVLEKVIPLLFKCEDLIRYRNWESVSRDFHSIAGIMISRHDAPLLSEQPLHFWDLHGQKIDEGDRMVPVIIEPVCHGIAPEDHRFSNVR